MSLSERRLALFAGDTGLELLLTPQFAFVFEAKSVHVVNVNVHSLDGARGATS